MNRNGKTHERTQVALAFCLSNTCPVNIWLGGLAVGNMLRAKKPFMS